MDNAIWIYVYKDTINHQYNGDENLSELLLPIVFVREYSRNNINYNSYEEWQEGYTCDETEDLYTLAKNQNMVLGIR